MAPTDLTTRTLPTLTGGTADSTSPPPPADQPVADPGAVASPSKGHSSGVHGKRKVDSTQGLTVPKSSEGPPKGAVSLNGHRQDETATEQVGVEIRTNRLAARIAANQVEQLRQLSLLGYAPYWSTVETCLRLAARRVLESRERA